MSIHVRQTFRFLSLTAAALILFATTAPAQSPRKPLAIEDLYLFDAPRSVALAPHEKSALFIRTWIDAKTRQERHSLWIAEGSHEKARPLEPGEPDVRHAVYSPDGKWIAFLSTRPLPKGWKPIPPAPPYSDAATAVWLIASQGGPAIPLGGPKRPYGRVFNDGFYGRLAFSPDGKRLVFVADDGKDPRTPDDCWKGNDRLHYVTEQGTAASNVLLDVASGKAAPLSSPGDDPAMKPAKSAILKQLTPPGNLFLLDRNLAAEKVVQWKNDAGQTIEGVLTIPLPEVAKSPYKLLLYPHGGPHSRATLSFNFLTQVVAAHGYAVFQPNFRGSWGYGQKFIDADRFDLGGGDMRDILSGVDHLIREKIVDPEKQYVFGSSYGGFMTTWLVGQTTRFRAAAAQNAVTDMNIMWGLTDIQSWTQWELGGYPWEVPGAMRERSPLTHVARVKTPTLILHARDDRRVPLPLGQAYYQALKSRGVPTQMVIYPDEGHGIRQPRHREDVLRRVLDWFAKHS